jgi:hypothetical protein
MISQSLIEHDMLPCFLGNVIAHLYEHYENNAHCHFIFSSLTSIIHWVSIAYQGKKIAMIFATVFYT